MLKLCAIEDFDNLAEEVEFSASNGTYENELVDYIGNLVGVPIAGSIDLIGMIGNLALICCTCRPKRCTSMLVIVRGLAVADLSLLLLHFIFQVIMNIKEFLPDVAAFEDSYDQAKMIFWPLSMAAHTVGVLLTVLICAERWLAVCKPLKVRFLLSVGRTRRSVLSIFAIGVLLNFPRWFEYRLCFLREDSIGSDLRSQIISEETKELEVDEDPFNVNVSSPSPWTPTPTPASIETYVTANFKLIQIKTSFGRSFIYSTVYSMFLYEFIVYVVPIATLVAMTTHMLIMLKKFEKRWDTLSRAQQRENKRSALPICIVAIFIICETPTLLINCIDAYQIAVEKVVLHLALACSGFLVVAKCALNLVAYSVYSSALKGEFRSLVKSLSLTASSAKTIRANRKSYSSSRSHWSLLHRSSL